MMISFPQVEFWRFERVKPALMLEHVQMRCGFCRVCRGRGRNRLLEAIRISFSNSQVTSIKGQQDYQEQKKMKRLGPAKENPLLRYFKYPFHDAFAKILKMAKQKIQPTRPGVFSGAKACI